MQSHLQILLLLLLSTASAAQSYNKVALIGSAQKFADEYLHHEAGFSGRWTGKTVQDQSGYYDPPHEPVHMAALCSNLWLATKDDRYRTAAFDILVSYGQFIPQYKATDAIAALYGRETPPIPHPFIFREYLLACAAIWPALNETQHERLSRWILPSARYAGDNLEWGAMNRSMIGAMNVRLSVQLCGGDSLGIWRKCADQIIRDNLEGPGLEDSEKYMLIRLHAILEYLNISGRKWAQKALAAMYSDYLARLFSPDGSIPDFGDASYHSNRALLLPVLEGLAASTADGRLKFMAQIVARDQDFLHPNTAYKAWLLSEAALWCNDEIAAEKPEAGSGEAGLGVLGKKVVFRDGCDSASTYLLLNYRGPSDFDANAAANISSSLHVAEEKMHHGHADENSTVLLMSGGSVLLHDGGYRSAVPSGPHGEYRADYFHNRVVVRRVQELHSRDGKLMERIADAGRYRPCATSKVEFTKMEKCDYSRTRVSQADARWQDDRCVLYLRELESFIIMDMVHNPGNDTLFAAGLTYTQHVDTAATGAFVTWYDSLSHKNVHGATKLLISYPALDAVHREIVFRHGGDEQLLWTARNIAPGDDAVFIKLLQILPDTLKKPPCGPVEMEQKKGYAICRFTHSGRNCLFAVRMAASPAATDEADRPSYDFARDAVVMDGYRTDAAMIYIEEETDSVYCAMTAATGLMAGSRWMVKGPHMLFRYNTGKSDHLGRARIRSAERTFTKSSPDQ